MGLATANTGAPRRSKKFFFEKKNQKTFARLSRISRRQPSKSFCFFFQKEALPCPVPVA
jgi:hypothetical protein